jgi:Carboxypeptidase regulatory-like domain/HYDIN/CFA65/VesB-like, Ig-like domain
VRGLSRVVVLAMCFSSCGGSGSPTSPSSPAAPATRIIALSGDLAFGIVLVEQEVTKQFVISNTGNSMLNITGMTVPAGGGAVYAASFLSGAIGAGASQAVTVRFKPIAAQNYSGTLTVNGDQTSGINTLPISGTGTNPAPPPAPAAAAFTLAGVILDSASERALRGAVVTATDSVSNRRSSTTDGNGYYSIPALREGAVSVTVSATGYQTLTRSVTLTADTNFGMFVAPNAAPPPPPPSSRVRIGAVCRDNTLSTATGSELDPISWTV